jgi:hypothetical protein
VKVAAERQTNTDLLGTLYKEMGMHTFSKTWRKLLVTGIGALSLVVPLAATATPAAADAGPYYTLARPSLYTRSGPGVQYAVTGSLPYRTPFTVVCQQPGSNVGGNVMWDRLPSGAWIADYWTTTPSYNSYIPGVPDCRNVGGSASSAAERAASWAESHLGQVYTSENPNAGWWSGWCEAFVEAAYGRAFRFASADAHYYARANAGQIRGGVPPRGAIVFWTGHVGISVGNGQVISTQGWSTAQRLPVYRTSYTYFYGYRGWAMP